MADQNKFEEMLERLINEDKEGAEELFHEIVVAKSRDIYEGLLESDLEDEEVDEATDEEVDESDDEEVDEASDEEVDESDDEEVKEDFDLDEFEVEADPMDDMGDEMGGDPADDMMGDIEPEAEEGEGDMEDRVEDLEDALDELKAEFEAMMAGDDAGDDEGGADDEGDEEADDDEAEEESVAFESDEEVDEASDEEVDEASDEEVDEKATPKSETEQMREYVEKISAKMGDDGDKSAKSPVAGKNDMGGTASNLAAGGESTKEGTQGGLANPATKEDNMGNVNVPGGKASKSMKAQPKGHGAEKKGSGDNGANTKSPIGA